MADIKKLEALISEVKNLRKLYWKDPRISAWQSEIVRYFKREFGEDSDYYKEIYTLVYKMPVVVTSGMTDEHFEEEKQESLTRYETHLKSFLKEVKELQRSGKLEKTEKQDYGKKVFIVHGHDSKAKLQLQKMLKDLGLEPVVLSDRPNMGKTIIEKFEQNASDVGYAFVLITPDDKCNGKSFRARQNVILELGYFMGKLGRERVCCLYRSNTEIPTDMLGVAYHKSNKSVEEVYKFIISELRNAGYSVSP